MMRSDIRYFVRCLLCCFCVSVGFAACVCVMLLFHVLCLLFCVHVYSRLLCSGLNLFILMMRSDNEA